MANTKLKPLEAVMIAFKGMAMGAADVVPGVSGGTIAFITGIYERLINGINNINLKAIMVLKNDGIKAFWKHVDGTFFAFLFGGIAASILSLAKVVTYGLDNYPVLIWSFFFGLVLASIVLIAKDVKDWKALNVLALLIGTAIAFYISTIENVAHVSASWYIFLSGAIAICAMILPGISGSFILVLMGSYHVVLGAIKGFDLPVIALFGTGCVIGLLSFSRLLKWLFEHYKSTTIALLTGFMIGSLYKIWPWKNKVGDTPIVVHSDGKEDYMMTNVLPNAYEGNAEMMYAIVCALIGLVVVIGLSRFAPKED